MNFIQNTKNCISPPPHRITMKHTLTVKVSIRKKVNKFQAEIHFAHKLLRSTVATVKPRSRSVGRLCSFGAGDKRQNQDCRFI